MRPDKSAFTFIEVLLVAVLMSVIAIATTQVFANGLRLWTAGEKVVVESDLMVFFDRFGGDARGVQPLIGIAFKGIGTQVSFSTIVWTRADQNGSRVLEEMVDQIGAVQYLFDPAEGKIFRRQANYAQALKQQWGSPTEVARGIEEVRWRYHFRSEKGLESRDQADDELPAGVSLNVWIKGKEPLEKMFQRYFPIPTGGGL